MLSSLQLVLVTSCVTRVPSVMAKVLLLLALAASHRLVVDDAAQEELVDVWAHSDVPLDTTQPVFLHGSGADAALRLFTAGAYLNIGTTKLGLGLHTTVYAPASDDLLISKNLKNYREYVWRAKTQNWTMMPRLVALQVVGGHQLKVAVVPQKFFERNPRFITKGKPGIPESDETCQGFDAFAVPPTNYWWLPPAQEASPPECAGFKPLLDLDGCTALSLDEFQFGIEHECWQEVKFNFPDGTPTTNQIYTNGTLPDFLQPVYFASNDPDTDYTRVISLVGVTDASERQRWLSLARAKDEYWPVVAGSM